MNDAEIAEHLAGFNIKHAHIHSRADELIACLEGEIAKRDARIAELESGLVPTLDRAAGYREERDQLRAELAAIKAQEPVAWLDTAGELYAANVLAGMGIKTHKLTPLYAAPVAKPQVVMPERETELFNAAYGAAVESGWESVKCMARQIWDAARLNADPVQQVSVPDGWKLVPVNATEAILDVLYSNGMDESDSLLQDIWSAMLSAAPAAPAADAGVTTND